MEDPPEPEVCEGLFPKSLAGWGPQDIELSSRPPAREGGMARRRGSIWWEPVRRGSPQSPGDGVAGTGVEECIDRDVTATVTR